MPLKVRVKIEPASTDDGKATLAVRSIQRLDTNVIYQFPINLQHRANHAKLMELDSVQKGIDGIKRKRQIYATLPDQIRDLYFDADDNAVFQGKFLDEVVDVQEPKNDQTSGSSREEPNVLTTLTQILEKLTSNPTNHKPAAETEGKVPPTDQANIDARMSLSRFNGRQNANEWMNDFEEECNRCGLTDSVAKVKCMRRFLDGPAEQWHLATAKKIKETDFDEWAKSFKTVFADRGWSNVLYAYGFKHMSGSLVEYALKKESLLLDIERGMSETSRICHIIAGLPRSVVEKIDRESVSTTDELVNELRRFEPSGSARRDERPKPALGAENKADATNHRVQRVDSREKRSADRSECYKCAAIGRPNRNHPHRFCRNDDLYKKMKEANLTIDEGWDADLGSESGRSDANQKN